MKSVEKLIEKLKAIEVTNMEDDRMENLESKMDKEVIDEVKSLITLSLIRDGKPFKKNIHRLTREGFRISPKDVDVMGWHSATITTTKGYINFQITGGKYAIFYRKSTRTHSITA